MATIQQLLDSWRTKEVDIDKQAIYEAKLHNWLITEKKKVNLEELKTDNIDNLTVSIMTKSFNKAFAEDLLPEQATLLQDYVFADGQESKIRDIFESRKKDCLNELNSYSLECENEFLNEKIDIVKEKISKLPVENIDDSVVSRYLTVMKLSSELRS